MNKRNILAIETATRVCSVAFSSEGTVLAEASLNVPQVHVERLVICINEMLENLHLGYADIDAVAVSNGPGSFTGLRIGLSVAKGIVFGRGAKLIAVPTLDSIAFGARDFAGGRLIVPLLHARQSEFYFSSFKTNDSGLERLEDYRISEAGGIAEDFEVPVVFVGEGVEAFSADEKVAAKFPRDSMKLLQASAREVAVLADEKFRKGEFSDLRSVAPLYIKDFVAVKGDPLKKLSGKISGRGASDNPRQKSGVEKS